MSASILSLVTILLVNAPLVEAGLRGRQDLPPEVTKSDVESMLMSEFSGAFRGGAVQEHIASLEAALSPMYKSMPKEADGTLGHWVVRYMLHRYFMQQHGWFVRGLEPKGAGNVLTWSGGNLTYQNQTLQEWVPGYLQNFLEQMQGGRGMNLRELAVLAATLEDLIHKESNQRLEMAFTALELPLSQMLNQDQLRQALEVYMMIYMLGGNFTLQGAKYVEKAHSFFAMKVKDWEPIQTWMHSIQVEVAPVSVSEPVNFTSAGLVVEEVGRRYGTYNDKACQTLKTEVLKIESHKAGRVRLTEFYKAGLSGVFNFYEKIEYLRTLGAVDESDPNEPYLIVPNYVAARPNCMKASNFYVICCRNECEELQEQFEKKFQAPMAKPDQILELVAGMSTKTVEAPRQLPERLVQRLHSIARANAGEVPLHGRLFNQWMHHAFPRECPYPQKAGASSPMTVEEFMESSGHKSASKTVQEMQFIVDSDSSLHPVGEAARKYHHLPENELPWDEAEELLHPVAPARQEHQKAPATAEAAPLEPAAANAPRRSFFAKAAPLAALASFFAAAVAFAMKMQPQSKQASMDGRWRDGMLC